MTGDALGTLTWTAEVAENVPQPSALPLLPCSQSRVAVQKLS